MKTILVIMTGERTTGMALPRAIAYALHTNATLHVIRFDHYAPIDYASHIFGAEVANHARHDYVEETRRWLANRITALVPRQIAVEYSVHWAGSLLESMLDTIATVQPDVVFKDVGGNATGVDAGLHGDDLKLLRACPAPLMLVRASARPWPCRILAAVDAMAGEAEALNTQILRAAKALAALTGAQLDVMSVFSYAPMDLYGAGFIADTYEIMERTHHEALRALAHAEGIPAAQVQRLVRGDTATALVETTARLDTDVLVMGAAHHSLLHRLATGTTAEDVLRSLRCDALIVRPDAVTTMQGQADRLAPTQSPVTNE